MERPTVTAKLKNLPMSPQKARLVADLVRGKKVNDAVEMLRFTNKKGSLPIAKLLLSAAANAEENKSWNPEDLVVSKIQIGDGVRRRWRRFVSRGRMRTIIRRYCNIDVELQQKTVAPKKAANKEVKSEVAVTQTDTKVKTAKAKKITKSKKA